MSRSHAGTLMAIAALAAAGTLIAMLAVVAVLVTGGAALMVKAQEAKRR